MESARRVAEGSSPRLQHIVFPEKEPAMTRQRLLIVVILLILGASLCLLGGCGSSDSQHGSHGSFKVGNAVMIPEKAGDVPFVIADIEGDEAVLLRREVLPQQRRFSEYSAYYGDSEIDSYLNSEYLEELGNFADDILASKVVIATESSVGTVGTDTETVERKVFLPSYTEVGLPAAHVATEEGKVFQMFESDGSPAISSEEYLLRSPNTNYDSMVFYVDVDGKADNGNAYDRHGIRPAFRVALDTLDKLEVK